MDDQEMPAQTVAPTPPGVMGPQMNRKSPPRLSRSDTEFAFFCREMGITQPDEIVWLRKVWDAGRDAAVREVMGALESIRWPGL